MQPKLFTVVAITLFLNGSSGLCADQKGAKTWGSGPQWGASGGTQGSTNLRETNVLLKNDQLAPTQNRTQAMRLEAATGHVNPEVDAKVAPLLPKTTRTKPAPRPVIKQIKHKRVNK